MFASLPRALPGRRSARRAATLVATVAVFIATVASSETPSSTSFEQAGLALGVVVETARLCGKSDAQMPEINANYDAIIAFLRGYQTSARLSAAAKARAPTVADFETGFAKGVDRVSQGAKPSNVQCLKLEESWSKITEESVKNTRETLRNMAKYE